MLRLFKMLLCLILLCGCEPQRHDRIVAEIDDKEFTLGELCIAYISERNKNIELQDEIAALKSRIELAQEPHLDNNDKPTAKLIEIRPVSPKLIQVEK